MERRSHTAWLREGCESTGASPELFASSPATTFPPDDASRTIKDHEPSTQTMMHQGWRSCIADQPQPDISHKFHKGCIPNVALDLALARWQPCDGNPLPFACAAEAMFVQSRRCRFPFLCQNWC
ncbi:hypothetical protein M758_6G115300 [Ceratodon purpureus]|nr:hypothetical protein M758_6G115300 [Ceratodon purpureus]